MEPNLEDIRKMEFYLFIFQMLAYEDNFLLDYSAFEIFFIA